MSLILLLLVPGIASALIARSENRSRAALIHVYASIAALIVGLDVVQRVYVTKAEISWNLLRADSLSAFMVAIITFIGAITGIYAVGYVNAEFEDKHFRQVRLFYSLYQSIEGFACFARYWLLPLVF